MDAGALFGLEFGALDHDAGNRCVFEGLRWSTGQDGNIEFAARKLQASGLRVASGPVVLEIGQVELHDLAGRLQSQGGAAHLSSVEVAHAELSHASLHGPLMVPPSLDGLGSALQKSGEALADLSLAPLAAVDGVLRMEITDAHLMFDADVTIPIRAGQIDFNEATVEHVGPDSRMGVSRMGIYVDAPNGRSYIYQFASAPVAGVEFEQRGAMLAPWVSRRGKLWLQGFAEALLRQSCGGLSQGLTEQARLLLQRTALSGRVQLGDGPVTLPGVHAALANGTQGSGNVVTLHSEAVGSGVTVEMNSLSVRDAIAKWDGMDLCCDALTARLKLQLHAEDKPRMRFFLNIDDCRVTRPRLNFHRADGTPGMESAGKA